jgi:hypothetical protein
MPPAIMDAKSGKFCIVLPVSANSKFVPASELPELRPRAERGGIAKRQCTTEELRLHETLLLKPIQVEHDMN